MKLYCVLLVILMTLSGAVAFDTTTSPRHLIEEPACTGPGEERVPCGNGDDHKLEVCHYSNNGAFQTLCVAENGAASGHMRSHDNDYCGPCTSDFPPLAFDFYQQVFGEPSLDENGEPVFPLFDVQSWTSPSQTGAYTAQTLDGQTIVVQVIEIVTEWNDILDAIIEFEDLTPSDLKDLTGGGYEATLVYGTIEGVGFLGLVATTVSKTGVSVTTLVIIDEAAYYGYGTRRHSRSLPINGCDGFFGEAVSAFVCPAGETVKVNQTCKSEAERVYQVAKNAALGEYDALATAAQVTYEAAKDGLLLLKARQYFIVLQGCTKIPHPGLIAACILVGAVAIERPAFLIKTAFEEALRLAIEVGLNNLDAVFAVACSAASASADACLDCEASCGNSNWSCGATLTICGSGGLYGICVCDLDTEGVSLCWANAYCSDLSPCGSSSSCPGGSHCVSGTCCGSGYCFSPCGARRLENRDLSSGSGMTAIGME
jgi:hypothetical protein